VISNVKAQERLVRGEVRQCGTGGVALVGLVSRFENRLSGLVGYAERRQGAGQSLVVLNRLASASSTKALTLTILDTSFSPLS
jgi:hypothetical protein